MAHLKKSSTTGHLVKNSAGHLVKKCSCTSCDWEDPTSPSAVVIDLTNLSLSGCSAGVACSPDSDAEQDASFDTAEGCQYLTDAPGNSICWDGIKILSLELYWSDADCCWVIRVWVGTFVPDNNQVTEFHGPADNVSPVGIYATDSGCATGTIEVK